MRSFYLLKLFLFFALPILFSAPALSQNFGMISTPMSSSQDTWTKNNFVFEARFAGRNHFSNQDIEDIIHGRRQSSCEAILPRSGKFFDAYRTSDLSFGVRQKIQSSLSSDSSKEVFADLSDGAFDSWIADQGYDAAKVQKLRELEYSFDPRRVAWLRWVHEKVDVRVRIFDASQIVFDDGVAWGGVSEQTKLSPMERKDPSLKLPWSASGSETLRNSHFVFELGVLNQDLEIIGGVPAAYNAVASFLDRKVFAGSYARGWEPDLFDLKEGTIQITARPANARLNQRYGFEAVEFNGDMLKTFDGMLVMKMDLREFIKRYIKAPSNPATRALR